MSFVTLTYALFLYFFSLLFLLPLLIKTLVYLHASSSIRQLLMVVFLAILCSIGLAVPTAMFYLSLVVG